MSEEREYRVRWRREGGRTVTVIRQTAAAAARKASAILALEEVKRETRRFADMPDLADPPSIETRAVGPWERADESLQVRAADDDTRARLSEWAEPRDDGGPFF